MPRSSITFPIIPRFMLLFLTICLSVSTGRGQEYIYNAVISRVDRPKLIDHPTSATLMMIHEGNLYDEFPFESIRTMMMETPFPDFEIIPYHPSYYFRRNNTTIDGTVRFESFSAIPKAEFINLLRERQEAQTFLVEYLKTAYQRELFHVKHRFSQNNGGIASDYTNPYEIIPLIDSKGLTSNSDISKLQKSPSQKQTLQLSVYSSSGLPVESDVKVSLQYSFMFMFGELEPASIDSKNQFSFSTPKIGYARYQVETEQYGVNYSPIFSLSSLAKPNSIVLRNESEIVHGQLFDALLQPLPNRQVTARMITGQKLITSTDQLGYFQFWPVSEEVTAIEVRSRPLNGSPESRLALPKEKGEEYFLIFDYLIPVEGTL